MTTRKFWPTGSFFAPKTLARSNTSTIENMSNVPCQLVGL